jgi:glycosyltransferase involved in cell wall biosynthesis
MRLSVAMGTYQGSRFLPEQLESIAAQSRPPDELVVCDDRSTDDTASVVEAFSASCSFPVRLHRNGTRRGPAGNFEGAIRRTSGDVVVLADQDDVWRLDKLQRIHAAFASSEGAGLVFSDAELVDDLSRPIGTSYWESAHLSHPVLQEIDRGEAFMALVERHVARGATIMGAAMAFAGRYRDLVLPFPSRVVGVNSGLIHDSWIALLIAAVAEVRVLPEPLLSYRQHAAQQIGLHMDDQTHGVRVNSRRLRYALRSRSAPSQPHLVDFRLVRDRLLEHQHQDASRSERAVMLLEDRLGHLEARIALPAQRRRRLAPVCRELRTGRYTSYSSGVLSAGRDLLL